MTPARTPRAAPAARASALAERLDAASHRAYVRGIDARRAGQDPSRHDRRQDLLNARRRRVLDRHHPVTSAPRGRYDARTGGYYTGD